MQTVEPVEPSKSSLSSFLPKVFRRNLTILGILTAIASGGWMIYQASQAKEAESTAKTALVQPILSKSVVALGRLEPQGEVIKIGASGNSNRIAQLRVKSGDMVEKGQIIAVLDNRDRLEAELKQAKEQVQVHQSKLAQVKAGAKTGEIGAQQSTIQRVQAQWQGDKATQQAILTRLEEQLAGDISSQKASILKLEAELGNAKAEYQRYRQLNEEGAVSASIYDSKGLVLETSRQQLAEAVANLARTQATGQQQIQEAKAALERIERTGQQQINEAISTLDQVAEVRPVDVQTAQAEVNSALAAVKKAQADLDLAYVRSPRSGQVLKVHTWEGEIVDNDGIIDLGQTAQMVAVAEVYESDVKRLKLGQTAIVTSDAFLGEAIGQVKEIGLQIYKNTILSTDPTAATDARVVEIKVLLDPASSRKVQTFTNLEVTVAIKTQ